jgi:hypothetical protein
VGARQAVGLERDQRRRIEVFLLRRSARKRET